MSSLEFPDLLYPAYATFADQPHEILLDQWPVTTMDLTLDRNFVMQKIRPSNGMRTLRATAPPFTYSIAKDDLSHINKFTLSTKSANSSTRLIAKHGHLIYMTKKTHLNIQTIPQNTYDELCSNTIHHLSHLHQGKHTIRTSSSSQLLDCTSVIDDETAWLTIATADQKSISFYLYNTIGRTSTTTSSIQLPDQTAPLALTFNPYVSSNAILLDQQYRVYQLDDDRLIYLHALHDEKEEQSDLPRQIFLDWDASPFLYTIADNHRGTCLLFDSRVRNEPLKELFIITQNHPYLAKTEILRNYQRSVANCYQHVFLTDYAVIIIDSRMANRPAIYSHHELLRTPTSFTQTQWNDQHCLFINDQFNTNVLQYGLDPHRRIIQVHPVWELCPISNSRVYLTNHQTHEEKEVLLAKSIYFDVPIRDMAVVTNDASFLLFQLTSAGNIHVQLFSESSDPNEEKTWNPDPDRLLKSPPDFFRHATDYWSTKFLPHFQCSTCLNYHVEPVNYTMTTPYKAMTQTSLRDCLFFKNDHSTRERIIPAELTECPTCACLPDLSTPAQLIRAKAWIQDWTSQLQPSQGAAPPSPPSHNWREVFAYDELTENNRDSPLLNHIQRPWSSVIPPPPFTADTSNTQRHDSSEQ